VQAGDDLSDRLAVVVGGGAAHRPVGPTHGCLHGRLHGLADRFASGLAHRFGARCFRFDAFGRLACSGRCRGEPALKTRLLLVLGIFVRLDGFRRIGRLLVLAELKCVLDRGKRRFRRILGFLRSFRHLRRRLRSVPTPRSATCRSGRSQGPTKPPGASPVDWACTFPTCRPRLPPEPARPRLWSTARLS
jgi:hypothetical protein